MSPSTTAAWIYSALYYYRARTYDPKTGRFLQQDPLPPRWNEMNRYVYVANRPTVFVDPFGLKVTNNSSTTICVKPGDGNGAVRVPPGGTHEGPVDGVSYPNSQGGQDVYKVTDPYDNSDIDVDRDDVNLPGPDCVNELGGGGRLDAPPDNGWNELFRCAGRL